MSNYEDKYLKYKKKYIDLKNELEGGDFFGFFNDPPQKEIIFFYDSANLEVNKVFQEIKEAYKLSLSDDKVSNTPFITNNDLKTKLNGLLNIYTYTFGTKTVEPYFNLNLSNIFINDNGITSRRMQVLKNPLKKAINQYKEKSSISISPSINKFITCDNLKYQTDKILKEINDKLNNPNRISATTNLLNIMKLYQNKTEPRIISYLENRIGRVDSLLTEIKPPPGTTGTITHIDEKSQNEEAFQNTIIAKMKEYNTTNTENFLNEFVLKIDSLEFNKLDSMIYFKTAPNNKLQVLNIFEPLSTQEGS